MSTRATIAIALLVGLGALAVLNAYVVDTETRDAAPTVAEGRILTLPGGSVQVVDEGPGGPEGERSEVPIVLVHCLGCSLRWWDLVAPILAERHRVVRVDLLGHGGSEKPSSGYAIADQSGLLAGALSELGVEGALVAGHSLGFAVSVSLAERASQLVDRLVNLGAGPDPGSCSLPLETRLAEAPLIGQAVWRAAPDFLVERAYSSAFAPGFDVDDALGPERLIADRRAMTLTSYERSRAANDEFREQLGLDERLQAAAIPLMSIFGAEDAVCDPTSQEAYARVPGARIETLPGVGHSPAVEAPERTAELIQGFATPAAAETGD